MNKKGNWVTYIPCECGYTNHPDNVKVYGTCTRCRRTMDAKAKFRHDMYNKLRLWKGRRWI